MTDGWKEWEGKKVFIILKNKRNYTGVISNIEISGYLVWITLKDKFGKMLTFSSGEIEIMQEEES